MICEVYSCFRWAPHSSMRWELDNCLTLKICQWWNGSCIGVVFTCFTVVWDGSSSVESHGSHTVVWDVSCAGFWGGYCTVIWDCSWIFLLEIGAAQLIKMQAGQMYDMWGVQFLEWNFFCCIRWLQHSCMIYELYSCLTWKIFCCMRWLLYSCMICEVYCCLRREFFLLYEMVATQLYDMWGVLLFVKGVFLLYDMVAA